MASNAYDPEAGKFAMPGGRRTLRLMLARKSRLVIGVAALFTIIFYLSQNGPSTVVPPPPVVVPVGGDGRLPVDDIWDDVPPPVEGVQGKAPAPPSRPPRPDHPKYYIIDENGDHFLPNAGRKVAPMHPGQKDIVDPADLFPEVELPWHFKAPKSDPFPRERMREIVSEAPDPPNAIVKATLDKKDFSQTWKGPADWNKAGPGVKNVQWPSFELKDRDWESTEQAERREERRKAVKRGFVHAWQAYKDHAWGECATRQARCCEGGQCADIPRP
jgi:mannosyl-oligosaccharide alpha-1,2-mannosidase